MYDNEHKKPLPLEWRGKQVSVLVCLTISPYRRLHSCEITLVLRLFAWVR